MSGEDDDLYLALRERMVERQLRGRGITDGRLLDAFLEVERHKFIPTAYWHEAYEDEPLPIGEDQTISQPYMVALMTQALGLSGGEKVLEVGTGSGYQAAILARLAGSVHTIERNATLAQRAASLLKGMGIGNVTVHTGDGTLGLGEEAPFDGIIVTAGGPSVPQALKTQLKREGGVLVIPVGSRIMQSLMRVTRRGDDYETKDLGLCRFVPLVGEEGW